MFPGGMHRRRWSAHAVPSESMHAFETSGGDLTFARAGC